MDVEFPQWVVDRVIARQGVLHPYDAFDPRRTAFVVVDLQNYFTQPQFQGYCAAAQAVFPAVNRLAGALRRAGGLVEIGRASCRGRGWMVVGAGVVQRRSW